MKAWLKRYWALIVAICGTMVGGVLLILGMRAKDTSTQMIDAQADADKQKAALDAAAAAQQRVIDSAKREDIAAAAQQHASYVAKHSAAIDNADTAPDLLKQWDAINDQPLE